jgi:iron complex outermembrane recepter protein
MINRNTPIRFAVGCALAALALPDVARAQSAGNDAPAATSPNQEDDDTATAPGDIIVTAQRRAERLQDVPLTVTVVSGEALQRQTITNITELQNAAPELNYTGQPSAGYSIRGSGTQTFTRSSENNVLVVLDGVVQGQLTPPTTSLFDIARVEVLGGPQGMLFGKNASAGVVNITSNSPRLGVTEGLGRFSFGERGFVVGNALLNIPLDDRAALRVTAVHESRGANIFNVFRGNEGVDDRETFGVRARLLSELSPTLRINLIGDYERETGGNAAWVVRSVTPSTAATSIDRQLAACGVTPGPENTRVCLDGAYTRTIVSLGASLQVDADIGDHTLTNVFGYRRFERDSDTDSDARPINALNVNFAGDRINQFSNELRIASPSGKTLEYVAGLFIYDYRYQSAVDQAGTLGALPFVATASSRQTIRQLSKAVFGQATVRFTDQFNLIAGGRYTWDTTDATFVAFTDPRLGQRFSGFGDAPGTTRNRVETENFSYRLGAQFLPTPNVTFFATYSRGYKGPALNNLNAGGIAPPVVDPEIPTNYEVGVKTALFDRRVNIDLTAYKTDVQDFQAQTIVTVGGLTRFVFANASELNFKGVQLNVYARPVDGFTLNGGVLYNDARYGSFVVQCNAPFLAGCTPGPAGQTINVEGRQLANAPRWKVTAGAGYEARITSRLAAFVDGNVAYRTRAFTSPTPDPNLVIDGYALVDARVGVRIPDTRFSVALFAKNLFDERAPTIIFRDPLAAGNYAQTYQANAFRVIGLTLEAGF